MSSIFVPVLFLCLVSLIISIVVLGEPQVPCYFIFGDSLADAGNNNNLKTEAKVNYPPYGIDFPKGPTGRFSNGQTYVDMIAKLLGFDDFIPPYVSAKGPEITKGVNYASGSAGILDETGQHMGERFSMTKQLYYHSLIVSRLGHLFKSRAEVSNHLQKCIYTVGIGSNDFVNNYFVPESYSSSKQYSPDAFANLLAQQLAAQLTKLYKYGARKVAVVGVGPVALTPLQVKKFGLKVLEMSKDVELYNERMRPLIDDLNRNLTGASFTFLNTFGIGATQNPGIAAIGLLKPCCKVEEWNYTCIPNDKNVCSNRNTHLFFDNIHPTEGVIQLVSTRYYTAMNPNDSYPYDIKGLTMR
ncbi:hypothetical protein QQ045_026293 [Rhodiola kirilowii]